jgi:hypothetical protein
MFYGIGSYGVVIALYALGPTWASIGTGIVLGHRRSLSARACALGIGLLSLRVQRYLLCHDHARGRVCISAMLASAAVGIHGR